MIPDETRVQLFPNFSHDPAVRVVSKDEQARKCYEQALIIGKEIEHHLGEGTALLSIGTLYLKRDNYDAALACFLLAERLFKMLESPELNEALTRLDDLRQKMGEEQFSELLANTEPCAQKIVDQALHDSLQRSWFLTNHKPNHPLD